MLGQRLVQRRLFEPNQRSNQLSVFTNLPNQKSYQLSQYRFKPNPSSNQKYWSSPICQIKVQIYYLEVGEIISVFDYCPANFVHS